MTHWGRPFLITRLLLLVCQCRLKSDTSPTTQVRCSLDVAVDHEVSAVSSVALCVTARSISPKHMSFGDMLRALLRLVMLCCVRCATPCWLG